jgi:PAS domain-containing protein
VLWGYCVMAEGTPPSGKIPLCSTVEIAVMNLKLRQSAEERLEKGIAPSTQGWSVGPKALTLLHQFASKPETASDALKLLHELQVHQVELDLQHEQAEQECRQLAEDLARHTALFDLAPFAYLSLDHEGRVIAANRMAADWLSPGSEDAHTWAGGRVEDLLAPECCAAVQGMLASLHQGQGRQTFPVRSKANGNSAPVMATATLAGEQVLMAFVPAGPGLQQPGIGAPGEPAVD